MLQVADSDHTRWAADALTAYEVAADKGHPYAMMFLAELRLSDLPNRPKDPLLSSKLRAAASGLLFAYPRRLVQKEDQGFVVGASLHGQK
jgi:hypothetical protein